MSFNKKNFKGSFLKTGAALLIALLAFYFQSQEESQSKNQSKNQSRNSSNHGASETRRSTPEAAAYSYLALVLSWSPTYCSTSSRGGQQCDGSKPYSFVLHGLWPQKQKGWPEFCGNPEKVSRDTVDSMLDIMPSPSLIKHEYKKHGSCMGISPEEYYETSRTLFEKINIPPRFKSPKKYFTTNAMKIRAEFITANPQLSEDMIAVNCGKGSENRLKEVKICFSKNGNFASCGKNEKTSRLCNKRKVTIPPVRG